MIIIHAIFDVNTMMMMLLLDGFDSLGNSNGVLSVKNALIFIRFTNNKHDFASYGGRVLGA